MLTIISIVVAYGIGIAVGTRTGYDRGTKDAEEIINEMFRPRKRTNESD